MTKEAIEQATGEAQRAEEGRAAGHSNCKLDPKRSIDLRQAIHQLQFASSVSDRAQPPDQENATDVNGRLSATEAKAQPELNDLARLQHLSRGLSSLSFSHAELIRPFVRQSAGDEPSSPSPLPLSGTSAQGSSDQLNGSASSSGGAPASSSEELIVPPSLKVLRAQVNQQASPVALPLEGKEDLLQQAVQEGALICIRSAFEDDDGSARTAQCLTYEQDHSYAEDVHAQAEHLRCMLEPLLVPGLPLPPPHPSTRCCSSLLLEGTLLIAPDKFGADYAPYVRLMVRIEDFEEVMRQYAQQQQQQDDSWSATGGGNGSRSLRNSTRLSRAAAQAGGAGGERIIALDKEGLEAARKSASGFMELLWAAPAPEAAAVSNSNGREGEARGAQPGLAAELGLDAAQLPPLAGLPM